MLKSHLKLAFRNIARNKVYSTINVMGLALGVCSCIVIYLMTGYDLGFDKFHPGQDRIYRIVGQLDKSGGDKIFLNSPIAEVAGFQNQIPGFEAAAGVHLYNAVVKIEDGKNPPRKFDSHIDGGYGTSTVITWPDYFRIFQYQWLAGNQHVSLNIPNQVVLSEKRARIYFGNIPLSEVIGKTVTYDDSLKVTVSGIVKDWDQKTDFGYTDFISIATVNNAFLKKQIQTEDWSSLSPHRSMAFVKLDPKINPASVNEKFRSFIAANVKLPNAGSKLSMWLQPLSEIHFTKEFHRGDDGDNFRKAYLPVLYLLMGLAFFILLIAAMNFINLSTAQSIQRSKEIGVRKVLGSSRTSIAVQFLAETFLVTFFALVLAVALVHPVLKMFSDYVPAGLSFNPFAASTMLFFLAVIVITTLLAGSYPAKILTGYLPVLSLKGVNTTRNYGGFTLRKSLIVFQFTISLIFIIGVLVVAKQIRFMKNADKGFSTSAIATVFNWGDQEGKLKVFADRVQHLPGISSAICQGTSPMGFAQNIDNFKYKDKDDVTRQVLVDIGDQNFIPFYGMKLVAGRNMFASDSMNELIINEACARMLGFTTAREALGKVLYQQFYQGEKPYPIVGVVADYHTGSFHEAIQPVIIENVPQRKSAVAFKLAGGTVKIASTMAAVETEWKKIFPENSFDYSFLDQSIAALFDQERKTIWLINIAMGITIFISCIGLFGLGMFTAERKRKEIGIRKVLGATVANIATMLSKEFVRLVLIAIFCATPIAWYVMHQWLQDFAYRTEISWWIFVLAGTLAILISLITLSFQAIKAALTNPAESLKNE